PLSPNHRLIRDAKSMGIELSEGAAARLQQLLDELERWNRTYNLTAIRDREEMVTHHLLDSLAIHAELHGVAIADVGTGAGFPGLPLAVLNPERRFTLIDSAGKKIRFVNHAAYALGLTNVTGVQARVETLRPEQPFDTVVTRAFAPIPDMLEKVSSLCGPQTRVLAMKGKWPETELADIPQGWRVERSRDLSVPGLKESRCVIVLTRQS
ncbi:MAG TPA: 16S rRNA (guanine(527)-N(7))-methyltransferase RsmG, partial [Steroidobacteraceae bacterium]|nr:16S rRNA (guanine(527)-N(7))-methyltransferase RsmG [Steroidobacteraceae bacterium]